MRIMPRGEGFPVILRLFGGIVADASDPDQ